MDNIEWNKSRWGDASAWEHEFKQGYAWGGREYVEQWFRHHVLPWIPKTQPVAALEIACGMGRFTEQLAMHVQRIHAIDLSEVCVAGCRKRFIGNPDIEVSLTDGKTLPEGKFQLIVSFDSLVHADIDVIAAYLRQAPDRLTPGGTVVIHHANHPDLASSRMDVDHQRVQAIIRDIPDLALNSQTLFRWAKPLKRDATGTSTGSPEFLDCVTVATRVVPQVG